MCAQCAATGAAVASTGAVGARVWIAAKAPTWIAGRWGRGLSALAILGGVIAAGALA